MGCHCGVGMKRVLLWGLLVAGLPHLACAEGHGGPGKRLVWPPSAELSSPPLTWLAPHRWRHGRRMYRGLVAPTCGDADLSEVWHDDEPGLYAVSGLSLS